MWRQCLTSHIHWYLVYVYQSTILRAQWESVYTTFPLASLYGGIIWESFETKSSFINFFCLQFISDQESRKSIKCSYNKLRKGVSSMQQTRAISLTNVKWCKQSTQFPYTLEGASLSLERIVLSFDGTDQPGLPPDWSLSISLEFHQSSTQRKEFSFAFHYDLVREQSY